MSMTVKMLMEKLKNVSPDVSVKMGYDYDCIQNTTEIIEDVIEEDDNDNVILCSKEFKKREDLYN